MIEEKTILNEYGEKIFVEVYVPTVIKSTIIFCHGITGCRTGRTMEDNYFQRLAKKLMHLNYKVVLFDFSGHGKSEGYDYDVSLFKSTKELEKVFNEEVYDITKVDFLVFSYGATVLCDFLSHHELIKPRHIVLYSPCLYPLESCFLNSDSLFGKDILSYYKDKSIENKQYAIVGAKNFRLGMRMIEECKNFSSSYLEKFADRILTLSGKNDVILDTKYNDIFCEKNYIKNIYLDASHSLFEDIDVAFTYTIAFLENENY